MESTGRNSFAFLRDFYECAAMLPDKQRLGVYDGIIKYGLGDDTQPMLDRTDDAVVGAVLALIKPMLDNCPQKSTDNGIDVKNYAGNKSCSPKRAGNCGAQTGQQDFDEFWKAYPRKVGKGTAKKAWERLKPTAGLRSTMLAAIETQKQSTQWRRDNGQFIPNPSTWLNQSRWEDELPGDMGSGTYANFKQRSYDEAFLEQFINSDFGGAV